MLNISNIINKILTVCTGGTFAKSHIYMTYLGSKYGADTGADLNVPEAIIIKSDNQWEVRCREVLMKMLDFDQY